VELRADHRFSAAPRDVAMAMVDPEVAAEWHRILDVAGVDILDHGADATTGWISARLTYGGSLDPLAARVLGSSSPTWVQSYRVDLAAGRGRLTIEPDDLGSVLQCGADVHLAATDGGTLRQLRGELVVRVPLLGGKAERALAPAIAARIDSEAALLEEWLSAR
jgi:hypothetical protein